MSTVAEPETIQIADEGITIVWKDGHRSTYPHKFLRVSCQCAHCVDEWTREARLDPDTVPEDITAVDQMPIGNYAVQFLWSDTHYTGIYTYEFLRSVCQCGDCANRAESSDSRE